MKKKNKGQKGYIPRNTSKTRHKSKKEKNMHDFKSKGQSETVNQSLIAMETEKFRCKSIIILIAIVIGALMLFFDIRDSGMMFEGFGIKFAGSMVGVLIIAISIIAYSQMGVRGEIEN